MTEPSSTPPSHRDTWTALNTPMHPQVSVARHLRGTLIAGLLTAVPLFVTVIVVGFIYGLATRFTQLPADKIAKQFFGERSELMRDYLIEPVIALSLFVAVVYILGLLGRFVIGRRMLAAAENFISNLPLIKGIYGTTKQVISVFRQGGGGQSFQRVVLVEFPRTGTWTIGFVTKTITDTATNEAFLCVFIPMTPNPTSGFFQMFPVDAVRDTEWTVDQGLKILLSGGLLAPDKLAFGKPAAT